MRQKDAMPRAPLLLLCLLGCTPARQPLRVFAAASLTESFAAIEAAFEAAHPEIDVIVSTAGSQALRLQIEHGAPADLFASANPKHARALVDQQLARDPALLARNALVIAVPQANPAGIEALTDLPRAQRLVIGEPTVPAGAYAVQALERAGIRGAVRVASREASVRLALAKVALGEADAALVYRTDTRGRAGIRAIALPWPIVAEYQIVTVRPSPAVARFRAFLNGPGRAILTAQGFD